MERYQVLFFNHLGKVFSEMDMEKVFSEMDMEADDERTAVEHARRIFDTGVGLGYEIRDSGKRLINRQIFR